MGRLLSVTMNIWNGLALTTWLLLLGLLASYSLLRKTLF
jgi:hypothetical protein